MSDYHKKNLINKSKSNFSKKPKPVFAGDMCMKGGMSCARKCDFQMSEPECTEVNTQLGKLCNKKNYICCIFLLTNLEHINFIPWT